MNLKNIFKGRDRFYVPKHPLEETEYDLPLKTKNFDQIMGDCDDLGKREIWIGGEKGRSVTIFYIDGIVDSAQLTLGVVRPLVESVERDTSDKEIYEKIISGAVYNLEASEISNLDEAAAALLNGHCVLIFDKLEKALGFQAKGGERRAVTEPSIESVLKGSKDAFVETLRVNTSLIRRKITTARLKIKGSVVGRQTRTRVNIVYIEGLTSPEILAEVESKLSEIDTDGLLNPAVLEEQLVPGVKTMFPLLLYTDLAGRFCQYLLQGRVGLLIDGLPFGYVMPASASQYLQAPEDDDNNYIIASVIRVMRYISMCLTLLLPGFYVAIANFHQEMIPFLLIRSIVESKRDVPFGTAVEMMGFLIAFEILHEAGLRLPKTIGQTISIIGALVIGQSAVEAKIVSPVVVIVVAIAGVSGYTIPNQDFASALRIWRFIIVTASMYLGLFGLVAAVIVLIYHLAAIETFGVSYLSPVSGGRISNALKRDLFRAPVRDVPYRQENLKTRNKRSQG